MPKLSQKDIVQNFLSIMVQDTKIPVEEGVGDLARNAWAGAKNVSKAAARGVGNIISPTATAGISNVISGVRKGYSGVKKSVISANPTAALNSIVNSSEFKQTFPEVKLAGKPIKLTADVVYIPFTGKRLKGMEVSDVSGNITMTRSRNPDTKAVEWKMGGIFDKRGMPLAAVRNNTVRNNTVRINNTTTTPPVSATPPTTPPATTTSATGPPVSATPPAPPATPPATTTSATGVNFTAVKRSDISNLWNTWYNEQLAAGNITNQADTNHIYPLMADFAKNVIENTPNPGIKDSSKANYINAAQQYINAEKPSIYQLGNELLKFKIIPENTTSMLSRLNKIKLFAKNPAKPLDFVFSED